MDGWKTGFNKNDGVVTVQLADLRPEPFVRHAQQASGRQGLILPEKWRCR